MNRTATVTLAAVAFFLSGAAALVYQVSWQRILALHTGVGIYSVSMIVGSFLAGLGLGSRLGGSLSTRLPPRGCLRAFAILELAVGLFGAMSDWLYYDLLYLRGAWLYAAPWRAGVLHLLSLLFPTLLMGMSLPLLARGIVLDASSAGRTVALFYGVNVLGAAFGAAATPWLLVPRAGLRGALLAAAAANLAAAALAALLARLERGRTEVPAAGGDSMATAEEPGGRPFALWLALYALSGFCALALEIVWLRLVEVAVKSRPFTFGSVLSLYLLGCGLGSLLGAFLVERVRRPLRAFLALQCVMIACSAAVLSLICLLPVSTPVLRWFFEYWRQAGGFELGARWELDSLLRLYLLLPALLFGLPTLLMGLSFPILQRAVHDNPLTTGFKVGLLQAANIAGCVAGSLLVGLVLLERVGSTGAMRMVVAFGLLFALVGVRYYGVRSAFSALAGLMAALLATSPQQRTLLLRLHGQLDGGKALVGEDATGVAAVLPEGPRHWRVFVGGRSHSWLPFGGLHTRLGILPVIVHKQPANVAIIGLGSGDTAWGAGARSETRRIDVFEVAGAQPRLLREIAWSDVGEPERLAQLRQLLSDPRVRIHVADGRAALEHGGRRYDVIEADALRPDMALSGNLYSFEFFSLCARRLAPGGLMCTWAPTARVLRTFRRAFPYVAKLSGGEVLIGSNEPLPIEPAAWQARLASEAVSAYLGEGLVRLALRDLASAELLGPRGRGRQSINLDLFPRDEFLSERP